MMMIAQLINDAPLLMLLQAGGPDAQSGSTYQTLWSPLISLLQGLLLGAGGLGILIGIAVKAAAGPNEARHSLSHKLIGAAATGLMIGLLAPEIVDLIFSWT